MKSNEVKIYKLITKDEVYEIKCFTEEAWKEVGVLLKELEAKVKDEDKGYN